MEWKGRKILMIKIADKFSTNYSVFYFQKRKKQNLFLLILLLHLMLRKQE